MRTSREVPLLIISKHEPNRVLVLRYREEARSVMRLRVKLTTTRYDDAASAKSHTASSRVWKCPGFLWTIYWTIYSEVNKLGCIRSSSHQPHQLEVKRRRR